MNFLPFDFLLHIYYYSYEFEISTNISLYLLLLCKCTCLVSNIGLRTDLFISIRIFSLSIHLIILNEFYSLHIDKQCRSSLLPWKFAPSFPQLKCTLQILHENLPNFSKYKQIQLHLSKSLFINSSRSILHFSEISTDHIKEDKIWKHKKLMGH